MTMFQYDLGDELKEEITGMKGIVMAKTLHLNGCRHYAIQPALVKGAMQGWIDHDESRFALVKRQKVSFKIHDEECKIELGDEVKDFPTGLLGIVVGICYYYDGTIYFQVQPSKVIDGKMPEGVTLSAARLTLVKAKKIKARQFAEGRVKEPSPSGFTPMMR